MHHALISRRWTLSHQKHLWMEGNGRGAGVHFLGFDFSTAPAEVKRKLSHFPWTKNRWNCWVLLETRAQGCHFHPAKHTLRTIQWARTYKKSDWKVKFPWYMFIWNDGGEKMLPRNTRQSYSTYWVHSASNVQMQSWWRGKDKSSDIAYDILWVFYKCKVVKAQILCVVCNRTR